VVACRLDALRLRTGAITTVSGVPLTTGVIPKGLVPLVVR
jgi:hypothetical protein